MLYSYRNLLLRRVIAFALLSQFLITPTYSQKSSQGKRVTVNQTNVPLRKIFDAITAQTSIYFMGSNDDINTTELYSLSVNNEKLEEVIRILLPTKEYTWNLSGNVVTIKRKVPDVENLGSTESRSVITDGGDSLINIEGYIVNEKGDPIAGATVQVKGTSLGAKSNQDGSFRVRGVKSNGSLVISNVAFLTREIAIGGKMNIGSIALKEYIGFLDETVVIAYGTTSQRYSAGAVNVVKGNEIETQPVNNPLLALQGRVPGVFITQSSGVPGSGVKILIQGQNSILNGNEPFYVIDGVPYTSQLLPSLNNNVLGKSGVTNSVAGSPLNYINPSDIESISILKDADATSIYGSRAANGAILITTKKGKEGQIKVDLNVQQGLGQVTRRLPVLNTREYLEMRREAITNDGLSIESTDYDINGFWDTTRDIDWQEELLGSSAKYTNAYASISGGTTLSQYLVSGNYRKETSVFPGDFDDQKGSLHFNITSRTASQRLGFQLTGSYMYDRNALPSVDLTNAAVTLAPNAPELFNADGSLNWMQNSDGISTFFENPMKYLYNVYTSKTKNLVTNGIVNYNIIKSLELKVNLGYTNLQVDELGTSPAISTVPENRPTFQRSATYRNNSINSWLIEPMLTYKRRFSADKLEAFLGVTIQQNNSTSQQLFGRGYVTDEVLPDIKSASNVNVQSAIASAYKYNAIFGRINYIRRNKYIIDINLRRDGSSRFGAANRFHNFGSVAGAWIFSEEGIIKDNFNWMSFGKIRTSFGTTGNDQIGDYQYLNLFQPYTIDISVPYQGITAYAPSNIYNPYLQWEETRKLQFGLDLGFLMDRIVININYNKNKSSNQLLLYNLPIITGFSNILQNFPAVVENKSWEFQSTVSLVQGKNIKWNMGINLTIPKNELVSFPDLETSSYAYMLQVGQPLNIMKVFKSAGVDPQTGVYRFINSKGETTSQPDITTDQLVNINPFPKFYGGLQNSFSYKGITLDFLFQFVKQTAFDDYYGNFPGFAFLNQPSTVLNRWQKPGDEKPIQRYISSFSDFDAFLAQLNATGSNGTYSDASYIRLKNASLAWQLPSLWLNKLSLVSAKLYFEAQNILTITGYRGLDPENTSTRSLPPLKMATIGLRIGL